MRDDTLDLEAHRKEVPFSGEFVGRELGALLFVGLAGIHHTVVHLVIPAGILGETSAQAASRRVFVSQSRFSVLPARFGEAESRLRDSLLPRLAASEGAAGALALRSRGDGFSGGLRWAPATLSEHGGGPPGKRLGELPRDPSDAPIPHEILSFWRTEADLLAGERWLAGNLPDTLADVALAHERTVDLRAESGELVLHAFERGANDQGDATPLPKLAAPLHALLLSPRDRWPVSLPGRAPGACARTRNAPAAALVAPTRRTLMPFSQPCCVCYGTILGFCQGIARYLVRHIERIAETAGRVLVSTGTQNIPAKHLYRRLGFLETGEVEQVPGLRITTFEKPLPNVRHIRRREHDHSSDMETP